MTTPSNPAHASFRVLVSGYYGFANLGDEAILAGLVEGFRQSAPEAALTVLSGHPAATAAEHGIRAVPRSDRSAWAQLGSADLFVSGGGGLLQDATSCLSPLYYLGLLEMARWRRVRTACIGQSIGPLTRNWIRFLTRRALSRADLVAVRDHHSAGILQGIGLRRAVNVTGDLAFLLSPPDRDDSAIMWRLAGLSEQARPAAAIAMRRLPGGADPGWAAAATIDAITACRQLGLRPVLVPMQPPDDLRLAEQVAARAPEVEVVRVKLTARQALSLLAGFDLVIAMRLHALIFAAIAAVPLVGISYDPKVEGMLSELSLAPATSAATFDASALAQQMRTVWQGRRAAAAHLEAQVAPLRAAAQRNIELCVEMMGGAR